MRLRKLHNAKEILNQNKNLFINNPKEIKDWFFIFNNKNKIYLEIGMGKGQFILQNAINNRDINYIGVELNETICAKAIKKINSSENKIENIRILNFNAKELNEIFKQREISKIFLNFSDPWPKARHEKNRLTSNKFLDIYKNILTKDGIVEFKTDNDQLYEYSKDVLLNRKDIKIIYFTNNLYQELDNEFNKNNIATEYENKFVLQDKNINKIIFKFL